MFTVVYLNDGFSSVTVEELTTIKSIRISSVDSSIEVTEFKPEEFVLYPNRNYIFIGKRTLAVTSENIHHVTFEN